MARGSSVGRWPFLVALAACSASACQDGYPIPPTRCDEWCEATQHECWSENLDPASCVVSCEQQRLGQESCASVFDSALTCMRKPSTSEFDCAQLGLTAETPPCYAEQEALYACGATPITGGSSPQE